MEKFSIISLIILAIIFTFYYSFIVFQLDNMLMGLLLILTNCIIFYENMKKKEK